MSHANEVDINGATSSSCPRDSHSLVDEPMVVDGWTR